MQSDLLIIGGGAAGLAAAYEASLLGLDVIIIEESPHLGGQFRQQTQFMNPSPASLEGLRVYEVVDSLIKRLQTVPVKILTEHTLVGLFADGGIGVSNKKEVIKIVTKRIVIATGANEGAVLFPGWTMPGVIPLGTAQLMINRERVYPGKQAVVIGTSDYAMEIVKQLYEVGIEIKAVVEPSDAIQEQRTSYAEMLERAGVPIYTGANVEAVQGRGEVEKVLFHTKDQSYEIDVDLVCFDGGLSPSLEPFYVFDCNLGFAKALGGWVPYYDRTLETTKQGVYLAGSAAGATCQASVMLTGALAGISAATSMDHTGDQSLRMQELWREIEQIEAAWNPELWQSRLRHMQYEPKQQLDKELSHWTY